MAPEDRLKAKQQTNEVGHASPRVRPTECCLQAPPDQPHAAGLSNAPHVYTKQASRRANPPTQPKAHQTATTSHVQRAARLFSSGRLRSRPQRGPKQGPARTKRRPSGKAPPRGRPRTASSKARRPRATRSRKSDTGAGHARRTSATRAAVRIPHTLSAAQGEEGGSKDSGQNALSQNGPGGPAQGKVGTPTNKDARAHA